MQGKTLVSRKVKIRIEGELFLLFEVNLGINWKRSAVLSFWIYYFFTEQIEQQKEAPENQQNGHTPKHPGKTLPIYEHSSENRSCYFSRIF